MLTLIYLKIVLIFILRHRREGRYRRIRSAKEHGTMEYMKYACTRREPRIKEEKYAKISDSNYLERFDDASFRYRSDFLNVFLHLETISRKLALVY